MIYDSTVELIKLVENEINLALTFLATAEIAGSEDHKNQALRNATAALETAERFAMQVPIELAPAHWASRLSEIRFRFESFGRERVKV
jgi:hypothetical protein